MKWILRSMLQVLGVLLISGASMAEDLRMLVSVQDFLGDSRALVQEICDPFRSESNPHPLAITCTGVSSFDLDGDQVKGLLKQQRYHYHVEILKLSQSENFEITTHNLRPYNMLDFVKVSNFYSGSHENKVQSAINHILQVSLYYQNHFLLRQFIVAGFAPHSKLVRIEKDQRIIERKTGISLTWKQAYDLLTYETPEREKVGRALLELSAVMGFASYIYHRNIEANREDFHYDSMSAKLKGTVLSTEGWVYDTNTQTFNTGHAFAGQIYYQTARSNGFSALKSFAITAVSSWFWEIFGERKEQASINDQVITPIGGAILGEAGFQIARAIRKRSNSFLAHSLAFLLDPMSGTNRMINRLTKHRDSFLEDLTQDQYAEMETYISRSLDESQSTTIGFKADVVNVPNFRSGEDGYAAGMILDVAAADMVAEYTKNKMSKAELKLITSVAWLGYHQKSIRNGNGYEALATFSSEFEYDKRSFPVEDFNLTVHIGGPKVHVDGYMNGFRVSATVAMYADFAMISSLALAEYDKANPNQRQGLQSIIKEEGYYYGFGVTDKIRLALSKANWTVFWEASKSRVTSVNSRDRFPEQVTKDYRYKDTKTLNAVGVSLELLKNISLTAKRETVTRQSLMGSEFSGGHKIRRSTIELNYLW
jgi:hypothetical protein